VAKTEGSHRLAACAYIGCLARRGTNWRLGPGQALRVLKPGGVFAIIGEAYKGGMFENRNKRFVELTGLTDQTIEELRQILAEVGFGKVEVFEHSMIRAGSVRRHRSIDIASRVIQERLSARCVAVSGLMSRPLVCWMLSRRPSTGTPSASSLGATPLAAQCHAFAPGQFAYKLACIVSVVLRRGDIGKFINYA
jgi:hypothetical protein